MNGFTLGLHLIISFSLEDRGGGGGGAVPGDPGGRGGDDDVDDDAGGKAPKMASSKHWKG